MKRRIFALILTLCMAAAVAVPAFAAEVEETSAPVYREPGQCGEDLTWTYENGTLTITGEGEMDNYGSGAPWDEYRDQIETVVLEGVTYIGACAFKDYDALKTVDFGEDLYEVGQQAFYSCDGLTSVSLPASFKIFGESSFQSCKNLTEFHCAGKFPTFRHNSMWDTRATIYFPAEKPWSVEYIRQLEEAFSGRIEFRASDGSDPYVPVTATEAPEETEAPTEAPVTEPPTEAPTEPPVTETQPVVTEAPTEAPTEPAEVTEVPTEPEAEEEEQSFDGSGIFFGIVIVFVVLTLVLIGALIFKGNSKKGKFSK